MTTRLQEMVDATMSVLRERNALPAVATSAKVRYAADYIVKKSPFAPFFAALGITSGSQIGRSFDRVRDYKYFRTIMQLYYAKWHFKDDLPELNDIPKLIKHDDWKRVETLARLDYRQTIRDLRDTVNCSIGKSKNEDYHYGLLSDDLRAMLLFQGTDSEFMAYADRLGAFPDTIVLGAHLTCREKCAEFIAWKEENAERIIDEFVRHGKSRALLSHCHGFNITALRGGVQSWQKQTEDRSTVCNVTHAELNRMAHRIQSDALNKINAIFNYWLMDFTVPGEVYVPVNADMNSDEIFTTAGLSSATIPQAVTSLAKRLAKKHGPVTITSESSGIHIYIPDPALLQEDGRKELVSKHLAINAEKYLGIGRYDVDEHPTKENKQLYIKYRQHGKEVPSARSMKTGKSYSVDALLMMPAIERRVEGIGEVKHQVTAASTDKHLVYDENGNLVPEWCGETVAITSLPAEHPARYYLETIRKYDIAELEKLWGVCYCTAALPEDRGVGRFYSNLPCGCKNSPTGRIILPIYDAEGVRRGWQARVIDFTNAHDDKFVWTDSQRWLQVASNGIDMTVSDQWPKGFAVHKYLNARGSSRNALLFGLKQAVEFNKDRPFANRYCVLVEGPLDAIRGGPPCIALLGKSMSPAQAELIKKNFAIICTVMDRDKAGQECLRRIYSQLPGMPIMELEVPQGKKDLGDCTYTEAYELVTKYDPCKS